MGPSHYAQACLTLQPFALYAQLIFWLSRHQKLQCIFVWLGSRYQPSLKFDPQSTVAYVHISWKGSIDLPQIGESPLVASDSTSSGDSGSTLFRRLCIHRSRLDLLFLGLLSGKNYLRTCPTLERFGVENSISMIVIWQDKHVAIMARSHNHALCGVVIVKSHGYWFVLGGICYAWAWIVRC